MLAEFLDRIVGLAHDANRLEFGGHPQLPGKVFLRHAGELRELDVPPPPRAHALRGRADLVVALLDEEIAPAPELYLAPTRALAFLDRSERRQWVQVVLRESARFRLCQELEREPRAFQPRDLVKFLRLELHGGSHDHVVQAMSRIDFTRTSAGRNDVAHGRESLGRSVEASVQQADTVPREFEVGVPLWTNPGFSFTAKVRFGVHLDLEAQNVELRVLSDECETARNRGLAYMAEELVRSGLSCPVFQGEP